MNDLEHIDSDAAFLALRLGLLEEAAERIRHAHLELCPACRERYEALFAADARPGHIPHSVLVRWGTMDPRLSALERDLMVRHLENCAECKDALRFLGLATTPEPVAVRFASPSPVDLPGSILRVLQATSIPTLRLHAVRAEFDAHVIPLETRAVHLFPRLPHDFPFDSIVDVTLESPEGSELLRFRKLATDLARHPILISRENPLLLGGYRLRVAPVGLPDSVVEYCFELRS